jgi:hypothetical protein
VSKGLRYIADYGLKVFIVKSIRALSLKALNIKSESLSPRFRDSKIFKDNHFDNPELNREQFSGKSVYVITDQRITSSIIKHAKIIKSTDYLSSEQIANSVFYIYFLCDSDALPEIRRIKNSGGVYMPHWDVSKTSYRFVNRLALNAMVKTYGQAKRISHFNLLVHENICEAIYLTRHLQGDYIEIGVYKGGSALTALNFMDELALAEPGSGARKVWLLDTFDGFNYESAQSSSDAIWAGTHGLFGVEGTIDFIRETLSATSTPVEILESNIVSDVLPVSIKKISVANIDVDMYEPTIRSLQKIAPLMELGGIIICEDPASTPGLYGALLAMEEFLESPQGVHYLKIFKGGQYFLLKLTE